MTFYSIFSDIINFYKIIVFFPCIDSGFYEWLSFHCHLSPLYLHKLPDTGQAHCLSAVGLLIKHHFNIWRPCWQLHSPPIHKLRAKSRRLFEAKQLSPKTLPCHPEVSCLSRVLNSSGMKVYYNEVWCNMKIAFLSYYWEYPDTQNQLILHLITFQDI